MRTREQLLNDFFVPRGSEVVKAPPPKPAPSPVKVKQPRHGSETSLDWALYRAAQIPGPGEYNNHTIKPPAGGSFNKFTPKGAFDDAIRKGKETPGPGDYGGLEDRKIVGGRMSKASGKSELEWILHRAAQIPGPGDHEVPKSEFQTISGGKFNMSKPKSDVEWRMYYAARTPGPGDYYDSKGWKTPGGKFNMSRPKTSLEYIQYTEKDLPGPGEYSLPPVSKTSGGRFNLSRPKSDLDWMIARAKNAPGPGDYDVSAAMQALEHTSSASLAGRSGPTLPAPYEHMTADVEAAMQRKARMAHSAQSPERRPWRHAMSRRAQTSVNSPARRDPPEPGLKWVSPWLDARTGQGKSSPAYKQVQSIPIESRHLSPTLRAAQALVVEQRAQTIERSPTRPHSGQGGSIGNSRAMEYSKPSPERRAEQEQGPTRLEAQLLRADAVDIPGQPQTKKVEDSQQQNRARTVSGTNPLLEDPAPSGFRKKQDQWRQKQAKNRQHYVPAPVPSRSLDVTVAPDNRHGFSPSGTPDQNAAHDAGISSRGPSRSAPVRQSAEGHTSAHTRSRSSSEIKRTSRQPSVMESEEEGEGVAGEDYPALPASVSSRPAYTEADGLADQGTAEQGAVHERVEGVVEEGVAAEEGVAEEGVVEEGVAEEGVVEEGVAEEGVAEEGVAEEGVAEEGVVKDSVAGNTES